jgi:hypothetical protein
MFCFAISFMMQKPDQRLVHIDLIIGVQPGPIYFINHFQAIKACLYFLKIRLDLFCFPVISQFFPVFRCPAGMRNDDGTANDISHGKYFVNLFRANAEFMALA